jgi:hypothetical protein
VRDDPKRFLDDRGRTSRGDCVDCGAMENDGQRCRIGARKFERLRALTNIYLTAGRSCRRNVRSNAQGMHLIEAGRNFSDAISRADMTLGSNEKYDELRLRCISSLSN